MQEVLCALERHVSRLMGNRICPRPLCDASYLGPIMIELTREGISFQQTAALGGPPITTTSASLNSLKPSRIRSWLRRGFDVYSPCFEHGNHNCPHRANPWGPNVRELACKPCPEVETAWLTRI